MRRHLRGGHSGDREPDDLPVESGLSDAELCDAWTASYEALRRAVSPAAQLLIVEKRQRYLDEFERRDPDGTNAWLESRASAGGDPRGFISGRRERP